ncbi:MAG: hypothetical protein K8U57_20280 [Planctomycetes bacterium]|nr:hypothetical protein [Planctomycetota bacterium]
MSDEPITIELLNPLARVNVEEAVPLQLLIRCPPKGAATVLRSITSRDRSVAELDSDLFERDIEIHPGEVYRCTVVAIFHQIGSFPEPLFVVSAGLDTANRRVRVPTPAIRVVPSLLKEIDVKAESICTYEHGTKVDVTISHTGRTKFDGLRLLVGPANAVSAGVSEQRRPTFAPGDKIRFTTVVSTNTISLELDASVNGEPVGPVNRNAAVPPVRDVATTTPFRFLEPKKLTQADVRIFTADEAGEQVLPNAGMHPIYGGGRKYRVQIKPAHPHASAVHLRGVSGSVEVTDLPADLGVWTFQMVVVSNGLFTSFVGLHYDVATSDGPQQGELNLAIRPSNTRLWTVALTAGAAVTVKGAAAVVPALANPDQLWNNLGSALKNVDTIWDLVQFLSIPFIRVLLWFADTVARPFLDD